MPRHIADIITRSALSVRVESFHACGVGAGQADQQQAERAAKMEAAAELAEAASVDDSLEAKLRAAGIKADNASAESVLARLKDKAKS